MPLLSMSDPPTSGPGFQDLLRPQPRCHFQLARWKNQILLPDGKNGFCCQMEKLAAFTLERVFQMLKQCIGKQSRHRGGSFEFSILSFL